MFLIESCVKNVEFYEIKLLCMKKVLLINI